MRTKQEIADFIRSLEILDRTYERFGSFCEALIERGDHRKITDFGLITGYGDAFSYRQSGIVIVGEPDVGKSQLVRKFQEKELSDILAAKDLLIYDTENNRHPEVYRDLFLSRSLFRGSEVSLQEHNFYGKSGEDIISSYANHLANNRGVPLRIILHLANSHPRGFAEPGIDSILSYLSRECGTLFIPEDKSIPSILQGATFLKYSKGVGIRTEGFPSEYSLERAYNDVKEKLDQVLS